MVKAVRRAGPCRTQQKAELTISGEEEGRFKAS